MQSHLMESAREVPVAGVSDVLVAGGGPAGMAAALAAARAGATVRLIETHGCLGGVWTAGLLSWMFEMNQPGIPREISQRLDQRGARIGKDPDRYTYDPEAMKLLLEEMCLEAGVQFQLHTRVCGVIREGRRLLQVLTESKSGRQAWTASTFVDCTGDGDLAAQAGCGFDVGRPGSGACQPLTFMALVSVPDPVPLSPFISFWNGIVDFEDHLQCSSRFLEEIRRGGVDPSYARPTLFRLQGALLALMVNHEYGVAATDAAALTEASVRGRGEVHRVVRALSSLGDPWKGIQLVATCEQIGVREGRRVHGLYTVSEEDLMNGRQHPDAICSLESPIDVHNTDPEAGKGQEAEPFEVKSYDIPVRSLIARDMDNLLMGGRCISGDFIAHSSYRVTGSAAATGQAAGVVAAMAALLEVIPANLPAESLEKGLAFRQSREK